MPELLPRFYRRIQEIEDARKIGRIMLENGCSVDEAEAKGNGPRLVSRSADGHDPARLRGLPATRTQWPRYCVRRLAASSVADRVGPSVRMTCADCGDGFDLSSRRAYELRRSARPTLCRTCRRPSVKLTEAERERYLRWWREESGLSMRQLHEIAVGLGGS